MKSQERYELLQKALSEGKTLSEAAREQGVTPALLSQVKKKHSISSVPPSCQPRGCGFNCGGVID
jgi:transposase-like protein